MSSGQPDYTRQVAITVASPSVSVQVANYINGRTASFEDSSFVTGDSPAVHNINSALGRNGRDGYIVNDGEGDLQYEISNNGTDYGGAHTLKKDETLRLTGLDVSKIRITWVADCGYRIMVV